jgi:hypothetical protein
MRITRFVCWLALPVGLIIGSINGANAEVSDAVRQACTPDAMRLCSEFIPDAGKVRTCMMRKRRELSEGCLTAIRGGVHGRRRVYRRERRPEHHYYHHYHYRHYHHYRHHD